MPAFYSRIFIFYNLIYSTFLYILPKTLKHFLPKSKTHQEQIQNNVMDVNSNNVSRPRQVDQPDQPCKKNQEELEHIFQIFDKNGDGRITKHELHDSLTSMHIFMSEVQLENMIEKIDVNGDGCVDVEELDELYRVIMDSKENENEEEDMMDAFNVFDQNRDGYIAVEELKAVFESLGLKQGRRVEECRRMIMKVDVDGDGKVSFSEFKEMMRAGGFAHLAQN